MRVILLSLLALSYATYLRAEEPSWFVAVYGENMQLISGASSTMTVVDGVFLDPTFVGAEIYVRVEPGYELDGFRPSGQTSTATVASAVAQSAGDAAHNASETQPNSEFGPLVDTGVQYFKNGDFFGWYCTGLFVQPVGDRVYRLRCNEQMRHNQ